MVIKFLYIIQLNLATMATMATEKSGHCREATIVERFEQESMNGLSTQKSGCCRDKYRLIVLNTVSSLYCRHSGP